jgi:hypothetical protein
VSDPKTTLQINLSPSDWRHAKCLLPHQIRTWRGQVAEILLTIDLHRSAGRFAAGWEVGRDNIMALAHSIDGARIETVDYGSDARARVSAEFFGGANVPTKDFRGGPYYAYFFGLNAASHELVLHADADIFFGGGSQTWISEAIALMARHQEILVAAPLPGPPASDGRLSQLQSTPELGVSHMHRLEAMSTRLFFIDRARFRSSIGALSPLPPPAIRQRIKALVEGNPSADLPEHLFTREMRAHGLIRCDFLGAAPGMWSLHPPYRCADFYEKLPTLVARVEAGEIPDAQRGDHDINSSLVDWSEATAALARNRWWRRLISR